MNAYTTLFQTAPTTPLDESEVTANGGIFNLRRMSMILVTDVSDQVTDVSDSGDGCL
ncbi:MAG: hypothetical protein K6F94_10105 [Bacteroidaceae bacterium]|nr:hypothetical protein [Bacteroidaceae bacterium]